MVKSITNYTSLSNKPPRLSGTPPKEGNVVRPKKYEGKFPSFRGVSIGRGVFLFDSRTILATRFFNRNFIAKSLSIALLLCFVTQIGNAQNIGAYKSGYKKQGNNLSFLTANGEVKIEFCSSEIFR
ncbi:MAG: hypothetical protein EOO93_01480, partial [Pedobacter sp.]